MNRTQICQQAVHLLKTLTWDSGDKIFFSGSTTGDDVFISPVDPMGSLKIHTLPCAIVRIVESRVPEVNEPRPEEVEYTMEIVIATSVQGDGDASGSMIGRNVDAGDIGRGLYDIEEKIKATINFLFDYNNVQFSFLSSSADKVGILSEVGNFASMSLLYNVRGTSYRTYGPPRDLRRTGTGSSVVLGWTLPSTRFDLYGVRLYRHTSKITTFGTGTEVALSSPTATSKTDTPGSPGTYYYALFGQYDETDSTGYKYSDPIHLRVTVT